MNEAQKESNRLSELLVEKTREYVIARGVPERILCSQSVYDLIPTRIKTGKEIIYVHPSSCVNGDDLTFVPSTDIAEEKK